MREVKAVKNFSCFASYLRVWSSSSCYPEYIRGVFTFDSWAHSTSEKRGLCINLFVTKLTIQSPVLRRLFILPPYANISVCTKQLKSEQNITWILAIAKWIKYAFRSCSGLECGSSSAELVSQLLGVPKTTSPPFFCLTVTHRRNRDRGYFKNSKMLHKLANYMGWGATGYTLKT